MIVVVLIAVGFESYTVKADVTGSFGINIAIRPIPCGALPFATFSGPTIYPVNCEDTIFKEDLETGLTVIWTISGMTLGLDTNAGFTGLEDVITSLQATLGAISITDNFIFSVPFGSATLVINPGGPQVDSEPTMTVINPSELLFVEKRVDMSISFQGWCSTTWHCCKTSTSRRPNPFP